MRINAPKGALNEELRRKIAAHKQAILELLQHEQLPVVFQTEVISRAKCVSPFPLSPAQERLWLVQQLEPGGAVFNLCRAVKISGRLNIPALEASLNEILRRHEVLRSKFFNSKSGVLQRTAPFERLSLSVVDLSKSSAKKTPNEWRRLLRAEVQRPFDFNGGRFLRVKLLRRLADEYLLILCTHHIVADAWSMGILFRELWALYETKAHGKPQLLPELPIQYRDYALGQRRQSDGAAQEARLAYWRKQLADAPALDLPTDRPRPELESFRGARHAIVFAEPLTAALNDLSRGENVTLFMTLLAAFQTLLHRYSGQDDILVGSPVANRDRREFEGLVGCFVNTLALRLNFSGAPSFTELLRRAREVCLDAYSHQEPPFEKIVAALNPQRDLSRHPLFQVMFVLQNTPRHAAAPTGLTLETIDVDTHTSQFDLSLYLRERDRKLLGYFEYASDLFDRATIKRMANHFEILLRGIIAHPEQPVATLPLLSERERRQLQLEWNETAADYPADRCIHELFETQVERTPDRVAVEYNDVEWTYTELNRRANRLARHLRALGVGPEHRVAICVPRSLEMAIGLLGILKAGGAYVPLDPAYPKERLKFMTGDAQVSLLLAQSNLVGELSQGNVSTICLDDEQLFGGQSEANLTGGAHAENAAYVIYTSGSTGTPKGVVGSHRGAVNRFAWMWRHYPFGTNEVCCSKTALSFIDSVWEIFGPLLQGIRLVIAPDQVAQDPHRLIGFLADHNITRIVLVPSLLKALLDDSSALGERVPKLRYWTSSGEALSAALANRFKSSHPKAVLLNLYGSSEVAGDVTWFDCNDLGMPPFVKGRGGISRNQRTQIPLGSPFSKGQDSVPNFRARGGVPIGRPIANTKIYLLDSHMQPVPVGVTGEIFVAGAGLARGYWRRSDLAAEKFLIHRLSSDGNSRLFRTGDIARYLPDGNLEYLGRADEQVKIRGQRVELGEVEAVLRQHPGVKDCAVVARLEERGEGVADSKFHISNSKLPIAQWRSADSLVAYVVGNSSPGPNAAELREFAKKSLPEFMVPTAFVALDALPRLHNGKVDRLGLQQFSAPLLPTETKGLAPRTEIETLVAQVWQDVLKLESVDVGANFFSLGGHSLLGTEVVAKLRERLKRPLSLRALFEAPTIESLSALIEKALQGDDEIGVPLISRRPNAQWAPLTPSQEQLFLFSQLFGGGDFLNMPYAYRLTGALDPAALERGIGAIINRHESLRTSFVERKGRPLQRVGRRRKFALRTVDLSRLSPADAAERLTRISRLDAARCFDLEKAPLLRILLVRMAEQEHVLLVTLHHIVSDQWSMAVFRRELAELYAASAKGLQPSLPALTLQFGDFAAWQLGLRKHRLFDKQIAYWRKQLAEPLQRLDFQTDRKRKKAIRFHSARRPIAINDELFAEVKVFARRRGCTPFMIFVAALTILMHKLTGQRDIRIATLVANRNRPGTESLIGYFVNALVLRAQVSAEIRIQELLEQVRGVCLDAYAHQDVPFEQIETWLNRAVRRGRAPLFQVMFNYRSQVTAPQEAAGLTIASWYAEHRAANPGIDISRVDLNFHLREVSTRLTGAVNFRSDLFDETRIAALLDGFRAVLMQIVAGAERRVGELTLV